MDVWPGSLETGVNTGFSFCWLPVCTVRLMPTLGVNSTVKASFQGRRRRNSAQEFRQFDLQPSCSSSAQVSPSISQQGQWMLLVTSQLNHRIIKVGKGLQGHQIPDVLKVQKTNMTKYSANSVKKYSGGKAKPAPKANTKQHTNKFVI